jgi:ectoine hydroxylase-related dioxygenase (phytanoyl-CoA dioxygenase family)
VETLGATTASTLDRDGFAIVPGVLSGVQIDRLRTVAGAGDVLRRGGSTFGGRNLLALPELRKIAAERAIRDLVSPGVGAAAIPVRALFFDKTPEANWPALWHQDLTIAVAQPHHLPGFGPWSMKAGIVHVEPPAELLAGMLTVRLHLDDCHEANGPLRVIPGSHGQGRLTRERIQAIRQTTAETICLAPAGAALLMRPLLLHASSPAKEPRHRRVLHIEFARADALPPPLRWAFAQDGGFVHGTA